MSVPTPWPSTFPAPANLFFIRSWQMPPNKEDNPMPVPEEKQIIRGLDLLKFKNPPARVITTSHPTPSVMANNSATTSNSTTSSNSTTASNSAMASIKAAINTLSSGKKCNIWEPQCPFCTQSAPHPSPVDSDWSEEDWDGEIEKEKRREKQRKEEEMKWRQEEEKQILNSNYHPPEPIYIPNHKEQPPTVVNDLRLAPENSRDAQKDKRDTKTEEDRRIIM